MDIYQLFQSGNQMFGKSNPVGVSLVRVRNDLGVRVRVSITTSVLNTSIYYSHQ